MSTEGPPADPSSAAISRGRKAQLQLEQLELELLLEAVFRHSGFDFRSYARSSLKRRVKMRMEAEKLPTMSSLQDRVLHEPQVLERLLGDLSVNVTAMFRDPTFFHTFREKVVPMLRDYRSFRIWHAGCATGEEVYATAILLREAGLLERARIYATDIKQSVLDRAKRGIFPLASMQAYTTNYLRAGGQRSFSEYYVAKYDAALFDSSLIDNVLFTQHNLATDHSFTEFNVIFCRNVMIYFDEQLQQRALGLFTSSLVDSGVLGLGKKESLRPTALAQRYEALSQTEKLYRKVA
jgi:chemotaxis protein methyltransferase CheR